MRYIGLDAGSVSVKIVLLDENGRQLQSDYIRHKGHALRVSLELLKDFLEKIHGKVSVSITGSSGRFIASILNIEPVNEVIAQARATRKLYPDIRTIFELGGEDSKLILLGEYGSVGVKEFSMNSVCAAGTGSFLDQQAERLRLTIEEFSELSLKSEKPPRIAGRCSVFAKSDMIHLQQIATPLLDIVAGLCFAVARNFRGSITRGRKIETPVAFQGGVAANKGMVRAFKSVFELDDLFVPPVFAFMGALGAVFKDIDEKKTNQFDIKLLEEFINSQKTVEKGYLPLIVNGDNFFERHLKGSNELQATSYKLKDKDSSLIKAFLGIDIGSISTNLAVIDESGNLLAKRYLMTAGRPIDAVNQGLKEISNEISSNIEIAGTGTTGSGRYMIADYVGADIVKNEITAQATAAAFIDKNVDTIFEIGGQDSKYISLKDGVIVDFEMNKACAAGTGSFLEEQAEKLNINIKNEFAGCALSAENPCRLGERCTVFMENSLMANLQRGADRKNLLAGLAYSIVQNYINRVVAGKHIGKNIFFQGGVAFNKSVVAAFEKYLDTKITVPPNHDVTGAIGMALIARDYMKSSNEGRGMRDELKNIKDPLLAARCSSLKKSPATSFKGFDLSKKPYEVSSFECKGCPNVCEINRIKISGEEGHLFYGGRCEKYDVKKDKLSAFLPDLFTYRDEMLWKEHKKYSEKLNGKEKSASRVKIGIPYIFYFHDYLPFWTTLLWELGFDVTVSPKTNKQIVNLGLESVLSETCFPIKAAHGHIKYLLNEGVRDVFIPSFINLNTEEDIFDRGCACPYTQTVPYISRTALKMMDYSDVRIISPVINLKQGRKLMTRELLKAFHPYSVRRHSLKKAMQSAETAQYEFNNSIQKKAQEVLSSVNNTSIVITGRAYNSFDSGMNLEIPKKLRGLNVLSIPMDFLSLSDSSLINEWPNMYWRAGQRILNAARVIRKNPNLYPVYIGNFSCGPDSFILKYFKKELNGKPFLHIEIDEHSADAGAITRCEAFLDSIKNKVASHKFQVTSEYKNSSFVIQRSSFKKRTVYIPRMSDHAFALASAFEKSGVPSEVLPESDSETIDIGKLYVSGKECYPCAVTTGDMLRKAFSSDFHPDKSAFFMPSGAGPCRFGQYNVFHRLILDEHGYDNVPIFSPNQDAKFYKELGVVGRDFTLCSWKGIIAIELLTKCLHETRPYEKEQGSTDFLYQRYLKKVIESLKGADGKVTDVLRHAKRDFENLQRYAGRKPLIGVIGEIFVRSSKFSNENLIRKIESLGGEAWLAPVEEWIYYVNFVAKKHALQKKDWSAIMNTLVKELFQKRIEHKYAGAFKGFLKTLKEPETAEIVEKASPYLHQSFEGEAILSIGKSIDLIGRGASGIVNAMPFGCMPGTIVTALMQGIRRDYGIPFISIPYDGTESLTTGIQLEAFMHQAKEYKQDASCIVHHE